MTKTLSNSVDLVVDELDVTRKLTLANATFDPSTKQDVITVSAPLSKSGNNLAVDLSAKQDVISVNAPLSKTGSTLSVDLSSKQDIISVDAPLSKTGSTLSLSTVPVASGGTGQTSFTSGRVLYGNGTSALSSSSSLTFDGTTLSASNLAVTGTNAITKQIYQQLTASTVNPVGNTTYTAAQVVGGYIGRSNSSQSGPLTDTLPSAADFDAIKPAGVSYPYLIRCALYNSTGQNITLAAGTGGNINTSAVGNGIGILLTFLLVNSSGYWCFANRVW